MSEITKLYENVEVKKQIPRVCSSNELYCKECEAHIEDVMPYCKNAEYPPFTAEKQIELIKWLAQKDCYCCDYTEIKPRDNNNEWMSHSVFKTGYAHTFEESLANLINAIWQDLSEEEKQQVKGILE